MGDSKEQRKSFNEILLDCVDGILATIGGSANCMIYLCLKDMGISKNQVPYRVDDLAGTLQSIFGAKSRNIELRLIEQIETKTKITCPFPIQASSLQDCVVFIRQEYESTATGGDYTI